MRVSLRLCNCVIPGSFPLTICGIFARFLPYDLRRAGLRLLPFTDEESAVLFAVATGERFGADNGAAGHATTGFAVRRGEVIIAPLMDDD